eukprot:8510275-Prorocentrum_lima.AAC.1
MFIRTLLSSGVQPSFGRATRQQPDSGTDLNVVCTPSITRARPYPSAKQPITSPPILTMQSSFAGYGHVSCR